LPPYRALYLRLLCVSTVSDCWRPSHCVQVVLWIFGSAVKIDAVTAAIIGLTALLTTGVVTWKECLAEGTAWDTLVWFAALIAMAGYLNKYGLIAWFSNTVVKVRLPSFHL
jgi:di/tricarboxylate transporter